MSVERARRVGTTGFDYLQKRNFADLPLRKYRYQNVHNYLSPFLALYHRLRGRANPYAGNLHYDPGFSRCELLHFFNTISLGRIPWVVSFSDFVPRWRIHTRQLEETGVRLLAGPHCKQLIALSQCNFDNQRRYLEQFPAYRERIAAKMRIMPPAQPALIQDYADKPLADDALTLTLVGGDFFRKGGKEILRAVAALLQEGYALRLNIVSPLNYGDYASRSTKADRLEAERIIAAHPRQIKLYRRLPNAAVLELFKRTHVGLLPTYDDTYGYSVLEAQAAGCPVITTDIRVMPEINGEPYGWLIETPRDAWGKAVLHTPAERERFSRLVTDGLYAALKAIADVPDLVRVKGESALARIRCFHSPQKNAMELEDLYDAIAEGKLIF
jgi:glycosyltransferase involved in cell wall biosynthesis